MSAQNLQGPFSTPAAIAAGVTAGTAGAEDALVATYRSGLIFVLRRRGASPQLAEDLCQDALLVVLERLRDRALDDPERLAGFVHRTGINLWINEVRKRDRRQTNADSEVVDRSSDETTPSPERAVDELQQRRYLRDLIAALPHERDRLILKLFYVDDLSKHAVCERLELSPRQFDLVVSRARQRLVQRARAESAGADV